MSGGNSRHPPAARIGQPAGAGDGLRALRSARRQATLSLRSERRLSYLGRFSVSTQPLVLVADDEPRITKLVAIALSEEGFRVVTANGGEQALQKAEEVRPDLGEAGLGLPALAAC